MRVFSMVWCRCTNRMGFRERKVDPEKKHGLTRVICMGDSVTVQRRPGYLLKVIWKISLKEE